MFVRQIQALCQRLWVLWAKVGEVWHILGVGGVSDQSIALCLAKIEPFYWPSDSSNTVLGPVK